jgi:hypothetical protein
MVDPKSYELAEYFLDDFGPVVEAMKMQLAQAIQNAVEDWIADAVNDGLIAEAEDEEPDPDRLREDRDERRSLKFWDDGLDLSDECPF